MRFITLVIAALSICTIACGGDGEDVGWGTPRTILTGNVSVDLSRFATANTHRTVTFIYENGTSITLKGILELQERVARVEAFVDAEEAKREAARVAELPWDDEHKLSCSRFAILSFPICVLCGESTSDDITMVGAASGRAATWRVSPHSSVCKGDVGLRFCVDCGQELRVRKCPPHRMRFDRKCSVCKDGIVDVRNDGTGTKITDALIRELVRKGIPDHIEGVPFEHR